MLRITSFFTIRAFESIQPVFVLSIAACLVFGCTEESSTPPQKVTAEVAKKQSSDWKTYKRYKGEEGYYFKDYNGNILFKGKRWQMSGPFESGFAPVAFMVKEEVKWCAIDSKGSPVLNCEYEKVGPFYKGLFPVLLNGLWGFANIEGNIVIDYQYEDYSPSINPKFKFVVLKDNLLRFINKEDAEVLE